MLQKYTIQTTDVHGTLQEELTGKCRSYETVLTVDKGDVAEADKGTLYPLSHMTKPREKAGISITRIFLWLYDISKHSLTQ
mgnify:CR=1 FL=1